MAVNVDTSWNHCARSCQQSRRRCAPCSAHTTEDDASLAERVVFIAVLAASPTKGVFFIAPRLCNVPRRLLSHKLFPSVVMSGQHGGAKLVSTLPSAEAAGSTTLCTTVDARDVQQPEQLTPSLLPRFPVGCARSGRNSRFGCAKMAAKFASMMLPRISTRGEHSMSSSFVVRWLLNSRVRFAVSGLPMEIRRYCASTLTTYKPAVSFCLRQHNQRHELGNRRRVFPARWPMQASSFCSAFCIRQAMLHPTRRSLAPLGVLPPDPSEEQM